jgi:hypothetical protein
MHNRLYFVVICFLVTIVSNCSMRSKVVLSDKQEVIEQFCSIGGEPDKPFVAGWSADEQQDLLRLASQGGVLLSYRGCNMTVVSRCRIKDQYNKVISTPNKKVMEITDSGRLYAELPMGARSLAAKVEGGRSLKLSYVIAATQSLTKDVKRKNLVGKSCKDATHYVEAMYLGAFRLEEIIKASGEANTLGGGGRMKMKASSLDEIGKLERCYEGKMNLLCQGVIKIKVSKLENEENTYRTGETNGESDTKDMLSRWKHGKSMGVGISDGVSLNRNKEILLRKLGIVAVKIPGGSFMMGSTSGDSDEKPVRRVRVGTFYMSKTEVTVGQYRTCVKAGVCSKPDTSSKYCKGYGNWDKSGRENHPINCVDWKQARTFAQWVGGDLPTEAQWEYAARSAGKDWKYPWGNKKANFP